jgi:O-antigen/teichoic acid export membrane protein
LRFLGAVLGALGIASLAYFRSRDGGVLNRDLFFQEIAFVPQLFALVFQHTAISFATYQRRQGLGQASMIIATSFSVAIPLYLASQGASIATLLFSQSWGGFISTIIVYLVLKWDREPVVSTRREKTKFIISGGPWGLEAWKALARDAWPYASVYAAITLWQRLDQIVTSEFLGFEAAGQYALAVRLAAIPMLIATSVGHALFPDLQRVGRDAPEKVSIYIGALVKLVFRWGLIAIACILAAAFFFIAPLVPKFKPAFDLLPWFLPGIWAYWMHSFVVGGLFGLRRYKAVVKAHALALIGYLMVLLPSAYYFGLAGVVVGSNSFSIFLFLGALYVAKRTQALPGNFSIAAPFSDDETALIGKIHHRFNRAPKSGVSQG